MFNAPVPLPCTSVISFPPLSLRAVHTGVPSAGGAKTPVAYANDFLTKPGSLVDISVVGRRTQDHRLRRHQSAPTRTASGVIVDTAAMVLPNALTIPARALTSVTSTEEESAMTQPPQQPPTQAF